MMLKSIKSSPNVRTALPVLCLVLVLTACAPSAPNKAIDTVPPGTVLFTDDFANPPSGWGTWNRDGASISYYAGGLRIQVNETQHDYWSVTGKNFYDVQVEVDAVKLNGPDDNDFGVVCRYVDAENFYALVISSDGYYGIAKRKDGEYSMIGADTLQYSPAIGQGQAVNHLRADCSGTVLRLFANGEQLIEVEDSDLAYGDVGLLAGAYDGQGVDIYFDNFVVKKPGE